MPVVHEDAIDTFFVAEELESVRDEVYVKYPEAKYSSLIPVDSSDDEGAEFVGYTQYDSVGASAIVASGTTDSPSVDVFAKKFLLPVHELGNNYRYDYREMRNAKKAGKKLDSARARVSATSIEQHHDRIAMLADGTNNKEFGGMYGMVFHPNFTKVSALKTFASATALEIIAYFGAMVAKIVTDTKGIYRPNTFAMSDEVYVELNSILVPNTSMTVLKFLKETYSDFTWETHYVLNNVGKNPTTNAVTATRVILCYHKSPDVLRYIQPMPYKTYPAVIEGRSIKVETASTSGGVEARQPLAVLVYHSF